MKKLLVLFLVLSCLSSSGVSYAEIVLTDEQALELNQTLDQLEETLKQQDETLSRQETTIEEQETTIEELKVSYKKQKIFWIGRSILIAIISFLSGGLLGLLFF